MNRNVSSSNIRDMEATLPLRPIRMSHTHESNAESSSQINQYPYNDYWRSPVVHQHYSTVQTSTGCHGFVNGNLGNVGLPSYHHQSDLHVAGLDGSLRLRTHPYGTTYSAMHASM